MASRSSGLPAVETTAESARQWKIPLRELDEVDALDINLDGADEVDSQFQMIKGRGGALLREKIVACAANHRVTMITADKRVDRLGTTMPLPVEVSLIGVKHTERRLQKLGASTTLRRLADGSPYLTDGGNAIIDCHFTSIDDPCVARRSAPIDGGRPGNRAIPQSLRYLDRRYR